MASFSACYKIVMITLATTVLLLVVNSVSAFPIDTQADFPQEAFDIVKEKVENAIDKETRMGASLIRLHFHDCFVNGCDGSILLDNTSRTNGEKFAGPNLNSARGFDVIDDIKDALEKANLSVSCADILAIAAKDAVEILGGPSWNVTTGRFDSKKASQNDAKNDIPPPSSNISDLITKFKSLDLSLRDLVALSGAHTVGLARCTTFRTRIYNETASTIDSAFAQERRRNCPSASGKGDNNLAPLDLRTQKVFDNKYYINLVEKKGLLHSDQELFSGGSDDSMDIVQEYADDQESFFSDFASAMIKMGKTGILTGSNGEIRKNCRKRN